MRGVFDSAGPDALAFTRTSVLPSALLDAVGTLIFAISELIYFGIPSLHMPLSNASSASLPPPSHGSGSGWSLLLSCMTLSFTTSRRFIPTLSKLKHAPPKAPILHGVRGPETWHMLTYR